jgi:hypothetical protein
MRKKETMQPLENHKDCKACPGLIRLQVRVAELEKDSASHNADIRALLEFKAGLSMLINLSIGGGALSIINLIVLLFILAGRLTDAGP